VQPEELAGRIIAADKAVGGTLAGATFSGGEPFSQARQLAELARMTRAKIGRESFSIVCFTGFVLEKLIEDDHRALLQQIDLLIDGPYVEKLRSTDHPLCGSSNQRLHFLTNRIKPEDLRERVASEVTLRPDGTLVSTGFPETW